MQESPIFTRTHDLLRWLLAARVQDPAFDVQAALTAAAQDRSHTAEHLVTADVALALLSADQYRHASGLTAEMGRLLGTWRKRAGS